LKRLGETDGGPFESVAQKHRLAWFKEMPERRIWVRTESIDAAIERIKKARAQPTTIGMVSVEDIKNKPVGGESNFGRVVARVRVLEAAMTHALDRIDALEAAVTQPATIGNNGVARELSLTP